MTTTEISGKLLVDIETGRVLRADDRVHVSARNIDAHPFMTWLDLVGPHAGRERVVFAGPDATRRRLARKRGEGETFLDAIEYEVMSIVDGTIELQKKEDI